MRQAVIYLRVSTIEQTTANQERELREIANRMGCEIVKVYRDHGISGAKGRDKRPAFDKLCVMPRDGNSTWSWRGRWTGWAVVCRTWSASCPSCTHSRSIHSCANRGSTPRRLPARRCFR
jgi:resolvase-like protein